MTYWGGENPSLGTLFEYSIDANILVVKHNFIETNDGGHSPQGGLMQSSNGKLYGMTCHGGSGSLGLMFEYDIVNSTYNEKIIFNGTNGGRPLSNNLIEIDNSGLGLSEIEEKFNFIMYPNPTTDFVNLQFLSTLTLEKIKLYNGHGSLINQFSSLEKRLNLKGLTAGMYYLKIETDQGVIIKKIIKK